MSSEREKREREREASAAESEILRLLEWGACSEVAARSSLVQRTSVELLDCSSEFGVGLARGWPRSALAPRVARPLFLTLVLSLSETRSGK